MDVEHINNIHFKSTNKSTYLNKNNLNFKIYF